MITPIRNNNTIPQATTITMICQVVRSGSLVCKQVFNKLKTAINCSCFTCCVMPEAWIHTLSVSMATDWNVDTQFDCDCASTNCWSFPFVFVLDKCNVTDAFSVLRHPVNIIGLLVTKNEIEDWLMDKFPITETLLPIIAFGEVIFTFPM